MVKKALIFIIVVGLLTAFSCNKDKNKQDGDSGTSTALVNGVEFLSQRVEGTRFYIEENNEKKLINRISLFGQLGEKIELVFVGENPETHTPLVLGGFPAAEYMRPNGMTFHAVDGNIIITEYKKEGDHYEISGSYDFVAEDFELQSGEQVMVNNGIFQVRI